MMKMTKDAPRMILKKNPRRHSREHNRFASSSAFNLVVLLRVPPAFSTQPDHLSTVPAGGSEQEYHSLTGHCKCHSEKGGGVSLHPLDREQDFLEICGKAASSRPWRSGRAFGLWAFSWPRFDFPLV